MFIEYKKTHFAQASLTLSRRQVKQSTKYSKSKFCEGVLNRIVHPNPTQLSKYGKCKVNTTNVLEICFYIGFLIFVVAFPDRLAISQEKQRQMTNYDEEVHLSEIAA